MQMRMPRLVDSHVGSEAEREDAMLTNSGTSLFSTVIPIWALEPLTGRSAVTAHVVSRHPLHLHQDGLGELLDDVVLSDVLVSFKSLSQRLLLAVLKH